MKIRSDFVSNSSSSSFIISTAMKFKDMVNKIICIGDDEVKENNAIALKYFCKEYTLLFFGYIPLWSETVNKGTDFEFDENIAAFDIFTKDHYQFVHWLTYKDWYKPFDDFNRSSTEKYTEEEARVIFKKEFMETVTKRAKYYDSFVTDIECGKITSDTIKMTENLIECGIDLHYDKTQFEKIKTAIAEGKSVYYITMGDDGEGMDAERLYFPRNTEINVHDPKEFKKIIDCDILTNNIEEIPE